MLVEKERNFFKYMGVFMETKLQKRAFISGAALLLLAMVSLTAMRVEAQPVSHPDFTTNIVNPADVLKYVNPLPNAYQLKAAPDTATYPGEDYYRIDMGQFDHDMGLRLAPAATGYSLAAGNPKRIQATPTWGYGYITPGSPAGAKGSYTFPGPTIVNTTGVPSRVTWTNSLPARHVLGVDPTLSCGANAANCSPENRVVVHAHGAHVWDDSDGNPLAWFSSGFAKTGETWKPNSQYGPTGTYRYINDQEAATTWYHDHAVGLTHSNVYAGLAGFFLVTDANEKALQAYTPGLSAPVLPSYAPGAPYEIPIALQDRVFYPDGRLALPDNPVLDTAATVGPGITCGQDVFAPPAYQCGAAPFDVFLDPATPCDTLSLINDYMCPAAKFSKSSDGSLIPYTGSGPAFTAPSITPEFFGNISLANGKVWPKQDVEPRKYRIRLLNGNDSRTYFFKFDRPGLPVWQIGTDQAFLNTPIDRTDSFIILMPGERLDLIVDFSGVPNAAQIKLENFAPYDIATVLDIPYDGTPPAAVGVQPINAIISDVLRFDVTLPFNTSVPNATVALTTNLQTVPIAPLSATPSAPVRQKSLVERTGSYGRLTLTLDGREYMDSALPVSELPKLGDTEIWEIANYTPDAHPIHLHQVKFQLINREQITWDQGAAGVQVEPVTPFIAPPPYTLTGIVTQPDPWEDGWKDTIQMLPGTVTRIIATFDLPGLYVWHCHILSHEESDMMRPIIVTTPAASVSATLSRNGVALGAGEPAAAAAPLTISALGRTGLGAGQPEFSNGFEYQFTVTGPNGYSVIRPYMDWMSPMRDSFIWTPLNNNPGLYTILVEARSAGSVAADTTTTLTYNLTAPAVASATSTTPDGSYSVGSGINITLNFNQAVSSAGLTINLNSGGSISTGPITNSSSFSGIYPVAAGQSTADLSIVSIAGTISDGTNSTVNPTIPVGFNIADSRAIAVVSSFTLTYTAGSNGTISGITPQTGVAYGTSGSQVTAVPDSGYHFVQWSDGSIINPRTDSNVTADLAFTASFAINSYSLTYAAGANGLISGNSPQTVTHGASGSLVTAVPAPNYHFVSWSDGVLTADRTDANVTSALSVTASFAINSFNLNYSAGANGSISGTASQSVNYGGGGTAVTAVASPNYHFVQWSDGSIVNPRTDIIVTAGISVSASFAIDMYSVVFTASLGGTVVGTVEQLVPYGGSASLVSALVSDPAAYHFVNWIENGAVVGISSSLSLTNITSNRQVVANFSDSYVVTPAVGSNGSVTPGLPENVNQGFKTVYVMTPASALYRVVNAQGCGGILTGSVFVTDTVNADCKVNFNFAPVSGLQLVQNNTAGYDLLQDSYNAASTLAVIKSQVNTFAEDLVLNRPINVTFKGGYEPAFTTAGGMTTVRGQLVVQSGQVTVDRLVVW